MSSLPPSSSFAEHIPGYLIAQYPAGYLLQRLPIGKFVGATIVAWGTLIITTPACTNFADIAANRFLLGMTEAVVNPSFVLVMAMWYQSVRGPRGSNNANEDRRSLGY